MAIRTFALSFTLLAIALSPTCLGAWRGYGTSEPDSVHDSVMFLPQDPPVEDGHVYFNGWESERGSANPNSGMLGSRFGDVGQFSLNAMLGIWLDCNQDGYVGLAEQALEEYPDAWLSAAATIADDPRPIETCPDGSMHRSGGWVTELLWIGPDAPSAFGRAGARDPRVVVDETAVVWADDGLYSDPARSVSGSCSLDPAAQGDAPAGPFLVLLDCYTGHEVEAEPEPADAPEDHDDVLAFPADPTPETCALVFTAAGAQRILDERWGSLPQPAGPRAPQACDTASGAHASSDSSYEQTRHAGFGMRAGLKRASDWVFHFSTQYRQNAPTPGAALAPGTFDHVDAAGVARIPLLALIPASQPQCFGIMLLEPHCFRTVWSSLDERTNTRQDLVRADLTSGDVTTDVRVERTYYAHVAARVGVLPGGRAVYGDGACSTIAAGAPASKGWDCDPTRWYRTAEGNEEVLDDPHATVGDPYELRDVDCYDGQVVQGIPLFVGSGQLGTRCDAR